MTLETLAGFMADITAAKIPPGFLSVAILPAISHPVSSVMGNRFLAAVTVDTVAGIMTVGAQASVMACFHPMAAVLPTEGMVARFLRPMTGFTELLPIVMAIHTGSIQLAGPAMAAFPILLVTCRRFFSINLLMTGRTFPGAILRFMALDTQRHLRAAIQPVLFNHTLVAGLTLEISMNLMAEDQIGMTLWFCLFLDLVIIPGPVDRMTDQTVFRRIVLIDVVTLLAVVHGRGSIVALLPNNMALIAGCFLFDNMEAMAEFQTGFFPTTVHDQHKAHKYGNTYQIHLCFSHSIHPFTALIFEMQGQGQGVDMINPQFILVKIIFIILVQHFYPGVLHETILQGSLVTG